MNIEEFDYTMGFYAFAENYFCNDFDVRNSFLISSLNKSYQNKFLESSIWSEYRKIYSVEQKDVSNAELKKRMITDFTNVFSETAPLEYFQSQPNKMGLKEILVVHGFARIFCECNLWQAVQSRLIDIEKNVGDFFQDNDYLKNNDPLIMHKAAIAFMDLNINNLQDFAKITELCRNTTLKIDNWINTNKINFHLISDLTFGRSYMDCKAITPEISLFTGVTKIQMCSLGLKNLPDEVRNLKNLTYIDLHDNLLEEFPAVLTELTKLNAINLSHNKIKSIPTEIEKLTKLKRLTLTSNCIISINDSLLNLNLDSLNLDKNPINRTVLPVNMAAKKIFIAETAAQQEKEQLSIRKANEKNAINLLKTQRAEFKYQYEFYNSQKTKLEQSINGSQQQQLLQQVVFHHQIFKLPELEVKKNQMKQFQAKQIKKLMELYTIKKSFDQGEHYRKLMNSTEPFAQKVFKQMLEDSKEQLLVLITLLNQVQQLQFKHRMELSKLNNQMFQQIQSSINIIEQKNLEKEDSISMDEDVKEPLIQNNKRNNSFDEDDNDQSDLKKPRQ